MPGQGPCYILTLWTLINHLLVRGTNKQTSNSNNNNIGRFPGGGLENQNPARTIAHSPPGVKETLNYMLREKTTARRSGCDDERDVQLFFDGPGHETIRITRDFGHGYQKTN